MKLLPLGISLISTALIPAVSGQTFEGVVQMKINDSNKTTTIQYQVKEGFVRMDIPDGRGNQASTIMDLKNQRMIIVMAAQSMYMTMPLPAMGQAPAAAGQPAAAPGTAPAQKEMPQKTGETKTILGYTCTKYVTQANGSSVEMWVTDELGNFAGFGGGGPMSRSQPPAWQQALVGHGFFPLEVTGKSAAGKSFSFEVTSINKRSLPDSVFAPPPGFRELNMGSMGGMGGLGGMMGGMGQRP